MHTALLILNAGSSSLKFAIYQSDAEGSLSIEYRGGIEAIGPRARFQVSQAPDAADQINLALALNDHEHALQHLLTWLEARHPGRTFRAAGHRVVHGGAQFSQPVNVDASILAALDTLIPLSPLHQPHNLAAIRALLRAGAAASGFAPGRLFRHCLPPHPAGSRATLRTAA